MTGMDDLFDEASLNDILDEALADDEEAAQLSAALLHGAARPRTTTPILSGRTMANTTRSGEHVDDTTVVAAGKSAITSLSTKKKQKEGGEVAMESIFQRAGLATTDDAFTVYRLEQLFNDEEIAELSTSARVAAIRAILKSHNVELSALFDDAVARRAALDDHDERLRQNIVRIEEQVAQENSALQAEIEEFANPRLVRMEANEQRLERLRNDYGRWSERKHGEQERLLAILEPMGGDDRLRTPAPVATPSASSQPAFALSGADVFDDPPGPARASVRVEPRERELAGESSSPRSVLVENDLRAEYHAADASREDLTGEFEFQRPNLRVPATPLEGLLAGVALIVWLIAGVLLTAQLATDLKVAAAWAVGLAAPLVLALVVSFAFRRGGWWTGFFMMLLYFSVVALGVAHYDPHNLITSLQRRPLLFIADAGLPPEMDENVSSFTTQYGMLLEDALGLPHQPPAPAAP